MVILELSSTDATEPLYVPYHLLDKQEMHILEHVRSGQYTEIKIQLTKKESIKLELTEEIKVDNAARVEEIFLKGAYQDLRMKTQDGVISYGTMKTMPINVKPQITPNKLQPQAPLSVTNKKGV